MGIFLRLHHKKDEEATGRHESKPDRAKAAAPAPSSSSSGEKIDERSVRTQIVHLQAQERACFVSLKVRWYDQHPDTPLSDETILRFARCAPAGPFDEASAWQAMGKFDRRYLGLSAQGLRKQLRARTVFPVPGLETKDGNECLYMNFGKIDPWSTPIEDIVDPLVYVLGCMNERERNATRGIALLANFEGWSLERFSMDLFYLLAMVLQGAVPTRTTHFLIVNPPPCFNRVLPMIKRLMSHSLLKVLHLVPERKLHQHLKRGYRTYLPHELASGYALTREIARDFVDLRRHVEAQQAAARAATATAPPSPRKAPPARRTSSTSSASTVTTSHQSHSTNASHSTTKSKSTTKTSLNSTTKTKRGGVVRKGSTLTDATVSLDDASHSSGGGSWNRAHFFH